MEMKLITIMIILSAFLSRFIIFSVGDGGI